MVDVKEACCEFLVTQLHPSNCLGIRAFADLHGCLDLLKLADKYTAQHFRYSASKHINFCKLIAGDSLISVT